MRHRQIFVGLFLATVLAATTFAQTASAGSASTTLHVAEDGQGTSCTRANPCGSIQHAVDIASPGNTIRIGRGQFAENILVETANLTFRGVSRSQSTIISAGGRAGATGNAGNPLDAVFEISAPNVTISHLTLVHPDGQATKRDAAVFAWAGSDGLVVQHSHIERQRDARTDEPTVPGSRGVFILLSPGSVVSHNTFAGNYQDHVHLPTGGSLVEHNAMTGASRAGVSVMDPDFIPNFPSFDNVIQHNTISDSLDDGIHIQGDTNTIRHNNVFDNGGYGVYLCGNDNDCYPPGANAVSEGNTVVLNLFSGNAQGEIGDFGVGNTTSAN